VKEHRLKLFENRVTSGIFLPKNDEVRGDWKKLDKDELRNFNSSSDIMRMTK
jgi:hypothetical protein